jgi:multiple sugar transport system substrate-binding protein
MRMLIAAATIAAALLVAGCGGSDSGGTSSSGVTTIHFWHGQTDPANKVIDKMVAEFNRTHPKIKVVTDGGGGVADQMVQKVTTALAGGDYPDIAYIFGSDVANLARSPKVADLTDAVKAPGVNFDDFWPGARSVVTVNGRVRAIPALVDDLAVVYNKKLFKQAGIPAPSPDWTWNDFRAIAKKLTDPSKGAFGTGWPGVGDEDTVWRIWPMVWQQGGDILSPDGTKVGFSDASGLNSLSVIYQMAAVDKSIYVDTTPGSEKMMRVFNSGRMGMMPTGPWALTDFPDVDYGVVRLPSFSAQHTTITGPDTWMVFDNGAARKKAATEFILWFTAPKQDLQWAMETGSLPLRTTTLKEPGGQQYLQKWPVAEFLKQLQAARARPSVPTYPGVSKAVGQALTGVLLGRQQPKQALDAAVQASNSALSEGS